MTTNKFESLLELLINEENDKAEALFHEIVVEKSRDIYENLADEETTNEAMHGKKDDKKDMKEIKMIPEMLNLLGCNKDDFKQLLKAMSYKISEKNNEVFFKYIPKKKVKFQNKENIKENPFGVLKNLNLN